MTSTAAALDSLAQDHYLRYRLDVIAPDVAGLVRAAGGWLYHRASTGWDVRVLVPPHQDLRPLQILGLNTADLETELSASGSDTPGHSLAVVADSLTADPRISARIHHALRSSLTEVVLWGERWPLEVSHRLSTVQHLPTVAGQAFKRQALAAADVGHADPFDGPEIFRSDQKHCLPVNSDLIPVG
ncbi:hypothetical protein [Mycolicibacter virginiensis]|uniref:Uncharacterized protein n=1 Tax=Mycolicibacter virginiensis TaxID=1795032 RepID=A0A9X7NXT1_9MYCO|nr:MULTISPECIES: hypothetical protein [Mycobacteriaceae]PQM51322.1 hypothetical protein C5U48_15785 [Mycolicibacter virginiensis]ULP47715.1 hypothetical protein MJO54_00565 [Mycolicibacter virginiensis]UVO13988.1 hypothetical protein NM962_08015 [Mycobacterium sp. SVM_VP21]